MPTETKETLSYGRASAPWKPEEEVTPVAPAGMPYPTFRVNTMMRQLEKDVDRVFRSFGLGGMPRFEPEYFWYMPKEYAYTQWLPELESFRRDHELIVRLDLPGLEKKDVKIEIVKDQLTISGERTEDYSDENDKLFRTERRYGKFLRVLKLPENVDGALCVASFKNGVLELIMPFTEEVVTQRKEIPIK